jgi:hypothetical protein
VAPRTGTGGQPRGETFAGVPLAGADGRVVGALCAADAPPRPSTAPGST